MSTPTHITLQDRLEDLFSYIREGRIIDAINEFYADDAMQENSLPPTVAKPIWNERNNFSTRWNGNGSSGEKRRRGCDVL